MERPRIAHWQGGDISGDVPTAGTAEGALPCKKEGWGGVWSCKWWVTCKNDFIFPLPLNLQAGTGFLLHHYFDTRWFAGLDVGCLPKALELQSSGMVSHPPGAEQMFAFVVSGGLRESCCDGFLLYLLEFLHS